MESTANYTGRVDNWLVVDKKLFLYKIQVNLTADCSTFFPDNGGRQTVIDEYRCTVMDGKGTRVDIVKDTTTYILYNDLHIAFSGKIVCARNFNRELYVHMGTQTENRFENRLTLEFSAGVLVENGVKEETGSSPDSMGYPNGDTSKTLAEIKAELEEREAKLRAYWRSTMNKGDA